MRGRVSGRCLPLRDFLSGIALAALLQAPGIVWASSPPSPPTPPSLLLVTIDTWRWDYIGASGSGKVETPSLDRLAREGVYEKEAVTPCPLTSPAHASIFTGLTPFRHGVWDCTSYSLHPKIPTLAEAFRGAGYRTAAFVAGETLKRRYGLDRGFELYDDSGMETRSRGDWMSSSRDGASVTEATLAFLRGQPTSAPLFIWAHYFDLHLPYRGRSTFTSRYPGDAYAAQVAFVDSQIARLMAVVEADPGRRWRIVVVGDHGEGLGEKGEDTHGMGLYRATLHVPLLLWPKPQAPLLHPKPWSLLDLFPTLARWSGLPARKNLDGEDLFGAGKGERALTAVSVEPALLFGVEPFTGVRRNRFLSLRGGFEEVYDLDADPGQARRLSPEEIAHPLLQSLRRLHGNLWPPKWFESKLAPTLVPSGEALRSLQSLGYLHGGAPASSRLTRVDMRKVLRDRSEWDRAREQAFLTKRGDKLLALYGRLVLDYPSSAPLHKAYGTLLAQAGRRADAIRQLEEALRLDARDAAAATNLGGLYLMEGKVVQAKTCLLKALELDPGNATVHQNLGVLYSQHLQDVASARKHFKLFLKLDPSSPEAPAARAYLEAHREGTASGSDSGR